MADQSAIAPPECQVYQALDPTRRQIRVLELHQGTNDALVDAVLIVTSVPPRAPLLDPILEMRGLLSRKEAELKESLAFNKRKAWLEAERDLLNAELEALKTQVRKFSSRLVSVSEAEDMKSRFGVLRSKMERYQRSRLQPARRAEQVSVSPRVGSLAVESEKISDNLLPLNSTNIISTPKPANQAGASRTDTTEVVHEHVTVIEYEAVSYCWDSPESKKEMRLNGSPFKAPSGAVDVLRNLRFSDKSRVLWIDAVCINQEDINERGQQVAMMGDIYSGSIKTLIWLGPSLDDSKTQRVLQLCNCIAQQITGAQELHQMSNIDSVALTCRDISVPDEYSLGLLDIVFTCRWFTRLWV